MKRMVSGLGDSLRYAFLFSDFSMIQPMVGILHLHNCSPAPLDLEHPRDFRNQRDIGRKPFYGIELSGSEPACGLVFDKVKIA